MKPLLPTTQYVVGIYSLKLALFECETIEDARRLMLPRSLTFSGSQRGAYYSDQRHFWWAPKMSDVNVPIAIYSRAGWIGNHVPVAEPEDVILKNGKKFNPIY